MILQKINNVKAFSIIELFICIAIIATVVSVVFSASKLVYNKFTNEVTIIDQTQEQSNEDVSKPEKEVEKKL